MINHSQVIIYWLTFKHLDFMESGKISRGSFFISLGDCRSFSFCWFSWIEINPNKAGVSAILIRLEDGLYAHRIFAFETTIAISMEFIGTRSDTIGSKTTSGTGCPLKKGSLIFNFFPKTLCHQFNIKAHHLKAVEWRLDLNVS